MNPATNWTVVILTTLAGVLGAMQLGKAPPVLPLLRDEFGLGLVAAGWVASSFTAMAALFGFLCGNIADWLGRRRTLLIGLALLALGSLGGSMSSGAALLIAARMIEGFGFVLVAVAAPSLIVEATAAKDQRSALVLWSVYMPTGIALAIAATPFVVGLLGWRGWWLVNALLLAASAVLLLLRPPARPRPAQGIAGFTAIRAALSRAGPWLMAGCFMAYALQWFAVATWLPTFVAETMGASATEAALITALVVFVNAPGALFGGWLLRHGAPRWILIAAAQAGMGLLALGIFADALAPALKFAMAVAFSFWGGLLPSSILAGIPLHAAGPAQLGAANGMLTQGAHIGSVLGPPALAALVIALGGWHEGRWLLLAAGLIGAALAIFLRAVERRL